MIAIILAFLAYLLIALTGLCTAWRRRALIHATSISLALQAIAIAIALYPQRPIAIALLFAFVATSGFLIEKIGVTYGIPFGAYRYTGALAPTILGVPIQIAVAWWSVTIPSFAVASTITPHPLFRIIIAAQLITAFDLFIDHTFVHLRLWQWQKRGIVFGIPLSNYAGWFLTAILICSGISLFPIEVRSSALVAIYSLTVCMQSFAYLFLWPWRNRLLLTVAVPALLWPLIIIALRIMQ